MSVPIAPYPAPPVPFTPPPNGSQSQIVCSGCRNLLRYPLGATSICCAVCNAVTTVQVPGIEMAQLVCAGCHTLLMYMRGASSVQCSCLPHNQSSFGSKSGCTCELWELPYAADVPVWSKICEMCSLQFCDTNCGGFTEQ